MHAFTGCILLLACLLIDVTNSLSRKMLNSNESFQIRVGNIVRLYNKQIHRYKTALLKRQKESNRAAHKSVIFYSEGEERVIAKKSKRDVSSNQKGKMGVTYQERIDLLMAHNHWRRVVDNPQASNMIYMVWSLELEKIALYWASNCRYDEGFPDSVPDKYIQPGVGIGQNIWSRNGSYDIQAAIKDFYKEKMGVVSSANQLLCNEADKCRRYKQVVWAESIYLGCAIVYCPTYLAISSRNKGVFNLVCNYSPAGNKLSAKGVPLQPYISGPPGTHCPPHHPFAEGGLCRTVSLCDDVRECDWISNTTTCLCDSSHYEDDEKSKSRVGDDEDSASETFMKSSSDEDECCSVRLTVSSISLSCSVFVTFIVTYAFSIDSPSYS